MRAMNGLGCCMAGLTLALVLQGGAMLDAGSEASQRQGSADVLAENRMDGVDIGLRVEAGDGDGQGTRGICRGARCGDPGEPGPMELRIGERVQICFGVSQAGYVSLWSQDVGSPEAQRLYPNPYAPGGGWVEEGEQCVGVRGEGYRLEVEGPAGDSLVFLHYTSNESEQIDEVYSLVIRDRIASVADPSPYASTTVRFRIVE